jgi:hypothetical protein
VAEAIGRYLIKSGNQTISLLNSTSASCQISGAKSMSR